MFLERLPNSAKASSRTRPTKSSGFWKPTGLRIAPRAGDSYVVIDDLVSEGSEQIAVLAIAPWPRLDRLGRLSFGERTIGQARVSIDPGKLQAMINVSRSKKVASDTDVSSRPLRIGDAFFVRSLIADPLSWRRLVDVSAAARERAKIALYAAAASPVSRTRADTLGLTRRRPRRDQPLGPSASRPEI
jgi:hypothetical protein